MKAAQCMKVVFVFFATIFFGLQGYSLTAHIIPTLGLTRMEAVNSSGGTFKPGLGVSVGALGEFGESALTFQTGLLYNQFNSEWDIGAIQFNFQVNYLSVPVLAKYNFSEKPDNTLYVRGGLMPEFVASKSQSVSANGQSVSGSNLQITSFDLPLMVGLGGAMPVGGEHFLDIGLDYLYSLTNISTNPAATVHNSGFLFTVGMSFNI